MKIGELVLQLGCTLLIPDSEAVRALLPPEAHVIAHNGWLDIGQAFDSNGPYIYEV